MHRRFHLQLVDKPLTTWRCAACQVPVRAAVQPTAKPCRSYCGAYCGVWLSTEMLNAQLPLQSRVRAVIEPVVSAGWGRGRMLSTGEPFIRRAVSKALDEAFGDQYVCHTIGFEHSRDSMLFEVSMRGLEDPILYRFSWPDWTPE